MTLDRQSPPHCPQRSLQAQAKRWRTIAYSPLLQGTDTFRPMPEFCIIQLVSLHRQSAEPGHDLLLQLPRSGRPTTFGEQPALGPGVHAAVAGASGLTDVSVRVSSATCSTSGQSFREAFMSVLTRIERFSRRPRCRSSVASCWQETHEDQHTRSPDRQTGWADWL
jgi:hypothetical protein